MGSNCTVSGRPGFSGGAGSSCDAAAVSYAILLVPESLMDYGDGTAADYVTSGNAKPWFRGLLFSAEHILYYTCAGGDFRSVWEWGATCMH